MLSVKVQYNSVPVATLYSHHGRLRNCWIAIIGLTSLALDLAMTRAGLETYFFFPAQLYFFMVGILLQRAYVMFDLPNVDHRAGYVAAAIMPISCPMIPSALQKLFLFATLIPAIPFLFALTVKSRTDSFLGDLSWPIYMVHELLITIASQTIKTQSGALIAAIAIAVSAAVVIASRRLPNWPSLASSMSAALRSRYLRPIQ